VPIRTTRLPAEFEVDRLCEFLAQHWRSDHVFVRRPEILTWQHRDEERGLLNFVIAEEDDEIVGLLGFIPFRRFDPTLTTDSIALAIWKVTEKASPGTGVQLLRHLMATRRPTTTLAIGLSDMVVPIYRALGFTTGVMDHFALFPAEQQIAKSRARAKPPDSPSSPSVDVLAWSLDLKDTLHSEVESLLRSNALEKSVDYYRQRFINHPWFRYQPLVVGSKGRPVLVVILRRVESPDGALFRIVDVGGELTYLSKIGPILNELLETTGALYVDLVMSGADRDAMLAGGFVSRSSDKNLVLPNYFDPFQPTNIDIAFTFKTVNAYAEGIHLHLADSDQDRPNS